VAKAKRWPRAVTQSQRRKF